MDIKITLAKSRLPQKLVNLNVSQDAVDDIINDISSIASKHLEDALEEYREENEPTLKDFDTDAIVDELIDRDLDTYEMESILEIIPGKMDTMVNQMKMEFFLKNIDNIQLEQLEKLVK